MTNDNTAEKLSELMRGLEIGQAAIVHLGPEGFYKLGKAIADQAKANTRADSGEAVVSDESWRLVVSKVLTALDIATGDTDPNIDPDMTDDEVRDEYPEIWAMQQLSLLLAKQPESLASRKVDVPNWNVPENPWYAAVTDACVINFIGWHEDDARKSLHELICWENLVALDPAVSSAARELIEKGRSEVAVPDAKVWDSEDDVCYEHDIGNGLFIESERDVIIWNACRQAMLASQDEVK